MKKLITRAHIVAILATLINTYNVVYFIIQGNAGAAAGWFVALLYSLIISIGLIIDAREDKSNNL